MPRSYVKFLPSELLPTFWTLDELQLLVGTTLAPAVTSKLKSLNREYDLLCDSAAQTRWFGVVRDHISFDDWLQVDAMYRSRALDFPDIGHCMIPCIDLANHQSGEGTIAVYEKDRDGNATLLLREGKQVKQGDEVTITYGDEKGACEMIFSYGFLEPNMETAETLFLSLSIPPDDSYRSAKMRVADCAPGVKLIDAGDGDIDWKGDFVWLLCVNAEDGLRFELARTVDGEGEEIQAFMQGQELTGGAGQLYALLGRSDLWDVYRLRAVTVLQQRVFEQLQVLFGTQEDVEATARGQGTDVREPLFEQVMLLRRGEFALLNRAYEDFEKQVSFHPPSTLLCLRTRLWNTRSRETRLWQINLQNVSIRVRRTGPFRQPGRRTLRGVKYMYRYLVPGLTQLGLFRRNSSSPKARS